MNKGGSSGFYVVLYRQHTTSLTDVPIDKTKGYQLGSWQLFVTNCGKV